MDTVIPKRANARNGVHHNASTMPTIERDRQSTYVRSRPGLPGIEIKDTQSPPSGSTRPESHSPTTAIHVPWRIRCTVFHPPACFFSEGFRVVSGSSSAANELDGNDSPKRYRLLPKRCH
ncbi:Amiloride-sensitive sodium channel family protein [Anopheles sinensis]|uniref:Amiloride-sensitive sodium channel family protein n=1 Tax=Anopheles sinensis TaxID=74873 RepID=A0A084WUU3_ANOSI|nr:Amiloride-sensitive sodium channel family protein [Anopheles sinensis]